MAGVWLIPLVDKCVGGVKLCDPRLTLAIPEHFRDEFLTIKRHTNRRLLWFTQPVSLKPLQVKPGTHTGKL